jgi:DNA repair protein RadA/Sms
MSKVRTKYVCQQCGLESPAFYGRCPDCGAWSSMVETIDRKDSSAKSRRARSTVAVAKAEPLADIRSADLSRRPVPLSEFSRVLGGGVVPGSLVLLGGDPGIGKSTLLLQVAAGLASTETPVLYITAEESSQQLRLRADRLGISHGGLFVLPETNIDAILVAAEQLDASILVVDSIQTVHTDEIASAAGSVSQVRECTSRLVAYAKPRGVAIFIVGHVTKEGSIAGPRVLEHMVDAVLYLEGERFQQFRILRGVKNRFGSTDEVGVFEMAESGMREVRNPSEIFLRERAVNAAGSAITVSMEGTRPILVEVQSLTTSSAYGNARRTANGFELNRLHMLIAVLSKRVGMAMGDQDVYVNVVGGLKLAEPAADLGVIAAIASSFRETRVDPRLVVVGEVGLSGELRSVSQLERRLNEAAKLGFTRAIVPATVGRGLVRPPDGLELSRVSNVDEAISQALV